MWSLLVKLWSVGGEEAYYRITLQNSNIYSLTHFVWEKAVLFLNFEMFEALW